MSPTSSDESNYVSAAARELRSRTQDLVSRLTAAGQSGHGALDSIADPLRSFFEASVAASSAPAAQARIAAEAVREQRAQLEGVRRQLELFEDQLRVLEQSLAPLVALSDQWSKSQEAVLGLLKPSK